VISSKEYVSHKGISNTSTSDRYVHIIYFSALPQSVWYHNIDLPNTFSAVRLDAFCKNAALLNGILYSYIQVDNLALYLATVDISVLTHRYNS
jgi:hypothetical protein